jgi:uncharacterized membrane protein
LLWERLAPLDPARLARLRRLSAVQQAGWVLLLAVGGAAIYTEWPRTVLATMLVVPAAAILGGLALYLRERPAARRLVWPARTGKAAA